MNATNLSMMITPNLLKGSNPVRDIMMSSVPSPTAGTGMSAGTAVSTFAPESPDPSGTSEGKATLGMVIAFCIRRYYEVFDELVDRTEAVAPWKGIERPAVVAEDASGTYILGEDDDLDDELSDIQRVPHQQGASAGPSSRIPAALKRHKQKNSLESNNPSTSARPLHESNSPSAWNVRFPPNIFPTNGKARSAISVESSPFGNTNLRRGSITIGKAATRKGSGSAVEAVSVTASGFFTPPEGVSPAVPAPPSSSTAPSGRTTGPEEEDRVLNVADRRRIFETDRI
jgi:Rho GTPase-activating protein 1